MSHLTVCKGHLNLQISTTTTTLTTTPGTTVTAGTKRTFDQAAIYTGFDAPMSAAVQQQIEDVIGRFIALSNLPLSLVEADGFKEVFNTVRPSFKMPTRRHMSHNVLDRLHAKEKSRIDDILAAADRIGLISDGWSNCRHENIINYLCSVDNKVYFYKSVDTLADRHTGEYIAAGLLEVIDELGADKVISITTDNAANMQKALREVNAKHPHIIAVGCCSHRLNLLGQDIVNKIPYLQETFKQALMVSAWFRKSHLANAIVRECSAPPSAFKAFTLPNNTRWQGNLYCIRSVIANFDAMRLAFARLGPGGSDEKHKEVWRAVCTDETFLPRLVELQEVLEPLLSVTLFLESEKPRLSQVYVKLQYLQGLTLNMDTSVADQIRGMINRRANECWLPLMTLAWLADPSARPQGADMRGIATHKSMEHCVAWLAEASLVSKDQMSLIYLQIKHLNHRWAPFNNEMRWNTWKHHHGDHIRWWKEWHEMPLLSSLCQLALSVPPTTGEAERNWSEFGNIHTLRRNKLLNERVNKLVYLHHNYRCAKPSKDKDSFEEELAFAQHEVAEGLEEDQEALVDQELIDQAFYDSIDTDITGFEIDQMIDPLQTRLY